MTFAQQLVLRNNPGGIDNIPKTPVNCDIRGNTGANPTNSDKSNGLFLKLQQSFASPQQSSNINLQQPTIYQTLQQPVPNRNLRMQMQSQFQTLPLNLQNQIPQQQDNQAIKKQCNQLQQQDTIATNSNSLIGSKPFSSLRVTGVSLAPLPVNMGHSRNLPSEASHGFQLSNPGLPSNFPYFAAKSCGCVNTVDQNPIDVPRANHGPFSNIPISVVDKAKYPDNVPIPISASSLSSDSANPTGLTFSVVPTSTLPQKVESQSLQSIDLAPTTNQSPLNQVILSQSQPFELIQMVRPVEYEVPPTQLTLKSVELDAMQTPQAVEYQPLSNQIQLVDSQSIIELQRQIPTAFDPNQNQYSDTLPINYPAPFVMQNNHGPKSSTMKMLLPLLIDLLKERNGRCQCPHNCNCGCMKSNSVNNNDTQIPPPEIIEGYANQRKYVSEKTPMGSNIVPEDPKITVYMEHRNNRKSCSEEENDDDEYEDVYEDVD